MRRRRSRIWGKNEPWRSFGICSSTSPALVDRAVPVAVVLPPLSPLVRTGSDHRSRLCLDEGLQDELDAVADEVDVAACTERVE